MYGSHVLCEWGSGALVVVIMELWASALHRFVWHGPLWPIHRSHHAPRAGRFERNDALSTTHAPAAIALIIGASRMPCSPAHDVALGAGIGMTVFGALYVLIHDGLVHERLPVAFLARVPGLGAIANAHREHHHAGAGGPYGLLFGPWSLALIRALDRASALPREPSGPKPQDPTPVESVSTLPDAARPSVAGTK